MLNIQPANKEAILLLAEIQRCAGKWDLAKEKLPKLLRLEPNNNKAKELLIDIRKDYGTFGEVLYYRFKDSNKLTQMQIPLGVSCYQSRFWEFMLKGAQLGIQDGKLNSTMKGYGANFSVKHNYFLNASAFVEVGAVTYSSSWTPLSVKLQFNQRFFNMLFTDVQFYHHETREGTRALLDKISVKGISTEFYLQASKRWSLSGLYRRNFYSDKNEKITTLARTNYYLFSNNPKVNVYGRYTYENSKNIFINSLPYWTPDRLATITFGMNIEQNINGWINLTVGYALANQQFNYSNNFNGKVEIKFSQFNSLCFQYQKDGSDLYNIESYLLYLQRRF